MVKNNIFIMLFHVIYAFVLFPFLINYNFEISKSVLIYLILLIPYLLFGLLLEPFLNYNKSKFKNLISFSSPFFIGIFLEFIQYFSNSFGPKIFFAMFITPSSPITAIFSEYFSPSTGRLLWAFLPIPYMILPWFGMELRRKIRKRVKGKSE